MYKKTMTDHGLLKRVLKDTLENNTLPKQDSLLASLVFLTNYYQKKFSPQTLVTGLPLKDNRLTPHLFVRAAMRAGIKVRVTDRKLPEISPHVLPVVLLMKDESAVLLVDVTPETGLCTLIDPATLEEREMLLKDLKPDYTGVCMLSQPASLMDVGRDMFTSGQDWFWSVLKQFRRLYMQVAVAAVLVNLMALVSPLFIMNVYDRVVPNASFETLWVLFAGVLIAYIFDFIFRQLRGYFIDVAGKGADVLMAGRLYQQVLNVRLGLHGTSSGAFANQLREFETLRDFFTSATMATLIDLPFVFLFISVIAMIGGPVALVPLLAVPIVIGISLMVHKPLEGLIQQATHDMDAKHGHLVETINSLETIKSMNAQSRMQAKWEQHVGMVARVGLRSRFFSALAMNSSLFIQQMVTVLVVVWGVYRVVDGDMTVGALIACTILAGRTMAPLGQAVALYTRFEQSRVALMALNRIMELEVERPDGKAYVQAPRLKGEVVMQDLSFVYPNAQMESLQNVNMHIAPGEKVALIGRTGSGKSTVARLILNLYNPTNGGVLLDGLEIRQIDPAEFRSQMGFVPQNILLFRGTLRENIMVAKPHATDEELVQAANMSGVLDFVRLHPMGFDMPVGERGEFLSGGQRQAVAIARALLVNPQVLVMDEPTSEMDNRSEEFLKAHLRKWLGGRTLILVTHRASLLDLVDRLIVMDRGHVVANGPKAEVLQKLQKGEIKGAS